MTSEIITGVLTLAAALGVYFGKQEIQRRRYSNGHDRRRAPRDACILAGGKMPDSAVPDRVLAHYETTTDLLAQISDHIREASLTLRAVREEDTEHQRAETQALRGIFKIQIALARKAGVEGLEFIDEPGEHR